METKLLIPTVREEYSQIITFMSVETRHKLQNISDIHAWNCYDL